MFCLGMWLAVVTAAVVAIVAFHLGILNMCVCHGKMLLHCLSLRTKEQFRQVHLGVLTKLQEGEHMALCCVQVGLSCQGTSLIIPTLINCLLKC